MDMSQAALPPRSGRHDKRDEAHPLFPVYRQYHSSMALKMVNSSDFRDWLYQHDREKLETRYAEHPEYPAFLDWMRANKGGARPCCPSATEPGGVALPVNFEFWLIGGRW